MGGAATDAGGSRRAERRSRLPASFPGSLSLNAAILASVMLASRLRSVLDVFALLAFAMEWFALFPIFRQRLKAGRRQRSRRRPAAD